MKIKVSVTQDHIDAANFLRDCKCAYPMALAEYCPVALALRDRGFTDGDLMVYSGRIHLTGKVSVKTSANLCAWIRRYDAGKVVHPHAFYVDIT